MTGLHILGTACLKLQRNGKLQQAKRRLGVQVGKMTFKATAASSTLYVLANPALWKLQKQTSPDLLELLKTAAIRKNGVTATYIVTEVIRAERYIVCTSNSVDAEVISRAMHDRHAALLSTHSFQAFSQQSHKADMFAFTWTQWICVAGMSSTFHAAFKTRGLPFIQ